MHFTQITLRVGLCLHPDSIGGRRIVSTGADLVGLPTALPSDSEGFTVIASYLDKLLYQEPILSLLCGRTLPRKKIKQFNYTIFLALMHC